MDIEHVRSRFIKHFDGTTGAVYASPGRINLIGEHTDYNGGFVFPGAIDKGMIAEVKPKLQNVQMLTATRATITILAVRFVLVLVVVQRQVQISEFINFV